MTIYIHSISYLPRTLSGAVRFNHELAKWFTSQGHVVKVVVDQIKEPYWVEGIEVLPFTRHLELMQWADAVIVEPARFRLCKGHKNVIVMQHTEKPASYDFTDAKVIYCGHHVAEVCKYACKKSMVLYPFNRYAYPKKAGKRRKDGYVLLINCNANKGGTLLPILARRMPNVQFVGVIGDYGYQHIDHTLPNLRYEQKAEDIANIYKGASILLMPSVSEGLPTVAMEAMSFGLPIVGFPIGGIMEVTDDLFATVRGKAAPYLIKAIEATLSDYSTYSEIAIHRAKQIDIKRVAQLAVLADFIK